MKKSISLEELRQIVRDVISEAVPPPLPAAARQRPMPPRPRVSPAPEPGTTTTAADATRVEPAPQMQAPEKPASSALPAPGALKKFKADVNMAVDAANRVNQNVQSANTKEALRWLDKMIQFATSAKASLGVK